MEAFAEQMVGGQLRLHLFALAGPARAGWVRMGTGLPTNFDCRSYMGIWQSRDAWLLPFDDEVGLFRPRSPPPEPQHGQYRPSFALGVFPRTSAPGSVSEPANSVRLDRSVDVSAHRPQPATPAAQTGPRAPGFAGQSAGAAAAFPGLGGFVGYDPHPAGYFSAVGGPSYGFEGPPSIFDGFVMPPSVFSGPTTGPGAFPSSAAASAHSMTASSGSATGRFPGTPTTGSTGTFSPGSSRGITPDVGSTGFGSPRTPVRGVGTPTSASSRTMDSAASTRGPTPASAVHSGGMGSGSNSPEVQRSRSNNRRRADAELSSDSLN
jgi:hypothetical protein